MKNKIKVTIASLTTLTILLSSCGITLVRKSSYDNATIRDTSSKYENNNNNDNYANTILSTVVAPENFESDGMIYVQMIEQMAEEKNFQQDVINILNKTIEKLLISYDVLYELYAGCNLPTKEEFINSFLLNISNNVDSIVLVDPMDSSNEYSSYLQNAQARFIHDTNTIVIDKSLSEEDIIKNLIHEECHSEQDYVFASNDCAQHNFYNIFTEGEAAWRTTLVDISNCNRTTKSLFISEDQYYAFGVGAGSYSIYSRYYKMLVDLAGYDVLQECKQNFDFEKLKNSIEGRYDIDAEKFLVCIADVSSMVDISNDCSEMDKFIIAEKLYLECIKSDIEKASTRDDVLNIFNKYRYYKLQYSFRAYNCDTGKEITNDKFMIDEIETLLFEKVQMFNIFDDNQIKNVFDICLFNSSAFIPENEEISITNVIYFIDGDKIYFCGKNNSDMKVYDCSTGFFEYIQFDEEIYKKCILVISDSNVKTM